MAQIRPSLEKTIQAAVGYARDRRHEYVTMEHLLLALTDDTDTVEVFMGCGVDRNALKTQVTKYIDEELKDIAAETAQTEPTDGFQRVFQRANIHCDAARIPEVSGAHVLVAIFAERQSHAEHFLQEQGMTRYDAVNYISYGVTKRGAPQGDRTTTNASTEFVEAARQLLAIARTKTGAGVLRACDINPNVFKDKLAAMTRADTLAHKTGRAIRTNTPDGASDCKL